MTKYRSTVGATDPASLLHSQGQDETPETFGNTRRPRYRLHRSGLQPPSQIPVGLYEVELSRPLPELPGPGPSQILVRLHGYPLGTLAVAADRPSLSAEVLAARIDDELGGLVSRHLAADGLPPATTQPGRGTGYAPTSTACRPTPPSEPLTVVVPTIGPTPSTAALLRALTNQTCPPAEILVIDNRPATSGACEFIDALSLPGVRYLAEPRRGSSHARNAGLAETRTDIVAFADDDVVVDARWLEFLAGGFDSPKVGCVTGLALPAELDTPAQLLFEEFGGYSKGFERRRFDRDGPTPQLLPGDRPDPLYPFGVGVFGSGANTAFRTDVLRELGGFDVRLGPGTVTRSGEDLDAYLSVVRNGGELVYEPGALQRHPSYRDFTDLRRQVHGYGRGLGALMVKRLTCHPADRRDMVRRLPAGLGYLLHPESKKNAKKSGGYPRSLTTTEVAGVLLGPAAFLVSAGRERLQTDGRRQGGYLRPPAGEICVEEHAR